VLRSHWKRCGKHLSAEEVTRLERYVGWQEDKLEGACKLGDGVSSYNVRWGDVLRPGELTGMQRLPLASIGGSGGDRKQCHDGSGARGQPRTVLDWEQGSDENSAA
jgi:hypothetical protein